MFNFDLMSSDLEPYTLLTKSVMKIVNPTIKTQITTYLEQNYAIKMTMTNKYFRNFDSQTDLETLQKYPHLVYVNTNQPIGLIGLFTFKTQPVCLYIDKNKGEMLTLKCQFSPSLYTGTIFEGEVITGNIDPLFLISDFLVYMNKNLNQTKLTHRLSLLQSIITGNHYHYDSALDPFKITIKDFMECSEVESYITTYLPRLIYKDNVSGLIYRPSGTNNKNLILSFPKDVSNELKIKSQKPSNNNLFVTTNKLSNTTQKISTNKITNMPTNKIINMSTNKIINMPTTKITNMPTNKITNIAVDENTKINHIEHPQVRFLLFDSGNPDDYCLKLKLPNGQIYHYDYALSNDGKTSQYLQNYLENVSGADKKYGICILCQYNTTFQKWKPIEFQPTELPHQINELI